MYKDRIYVPDVGTLRTRVLQEKHNHPLSGHFGQQKTLELVRHKYTWPKMRETVEKFVESCVPCGHSKSWRHLPYGALQQLPIPEWLWPSVSMDFIEQLPESKGHTAILVIVDRFTKQALFIPTTDNATASDVRDMYFRHVFSKLGVPLHITSDCGSEFVSQFFRSLGSMLNIRLHFTAGYHLSADSQTECVNQTLEQYLHICCNYQQDDWASLLPLAEFAYNNTKSSTTGTSPFFANKGYHPSLPTHPENLSTSQEAHHWVTNLAEVHERLHKNLQATQERTKETTDPQRAKAPVFKIGDRAFVRLEFVRRTRPSPKLAE
jgi:IS30 family transposase